MADFGTTGTRLGQALAGAMSGNAYKNAYDNEAMKLSQAAMAGAHADLYREQADQLRKRSQYQTPEFASRLAGAMAGLSDQQAGQLAGFQERGNWGMAPEVLAPDFEGPPQEKPRAAPGWYSPKVEQQFNLGRAAHLANLAGTGNTNAAQIADAFAKLLGQGRIESAMESPETIPTFGAAMAASQGKGQFNHGANGVMNQFTGAETLNDVGKSAAMENLAQAGSASASAKARLAQADLTRSKIGQPQFMAGPDGTPVQISGPPAKPMPAVAVKLQDDAVEAIGLSSAIDNDLGVIAGQLESGALKLGPMKNMVSLAKNAIGVSDENSRNYGTFIASLEKLRNDSLRMNKGVQTEGDAQRAWNEIMAHATDQEFVKKRLGEVQEINRRGAALQTEKVNLLRANYGHPPLDVTPFTSKGAAVSSGQPAARSAPMSTDDRRSSVLAARQAIAAGRDKAAVIKKLEAAGITDHGIE